jgi:hypothetical protein
VRGVNEAGKAKLARPVLARLIYTMLTKGEKYNDEG